MPHYYHYFPNSVNYCQPYYDLRLESPLFEELVRFLREMCYLLRGPFQEYLFVENAHYFDFDLLIQIWRFIDHAGLIMDCDPGYQDLQD